MEVTTTHHGPKEKQFAWSYSRLKNFEACPKKYYEIDVAKNIQEAKNESLEWGDEVHKKVAARIRDNVPLPHTMLFIEPWVQRILANSENSQILVEQKFAIKRDFSPTSFFANDVWFRAICDVLKISGDIALAVDWKTGKILEDGIQLALVAATVFSHFPAVHNIRTKFIWLKDDAESQVDFSREGMAEIWRGILPRVTILENATRNMDFQPIQGGLCKRHCPISSCVFNGQRK